MIPFYAHPQEYKKKLKLGINYGQASQAIFPFDDPNYHYENKSFKIKLDHQFKVKNKWSLEWHLETSYYISKHQLLEKSLNPSHKTVPGSSINNLIPKASTLKEYVINSGIVTRYHLKKGHNIFLMLSIGPMYSDQDTERLKSGFAFSDIGALGFSFKSNKWHFALRLSVRHNSNGGMRQPNLGHNSTGLDGGVALEFH